MSNNNTTSKIRTLQAANEDFEFYPTTPEIMEAISTRGWGRKNAGVQDSVISGSIRLV
jgi:hypothetical protein